MQLLDASGGVVSAGATVTFSIAPSFSGPGTAANGLTDVLAVVFDLGSARAVVGAKISRYGNDFGPRFPTACALDHSDDGTAWASAGAGVVPSTAYTTPTRTLSAQIIFA